MGILMEYLETAFPDSKTDREIIELLWKANDLMTSPEIANALSSSPASTVYSRLKVLSDSGAIRKAGTFRRSRGAAGRPQILYAISDATGNKMGKMPAIYAASFMLSSLNMIGIESKRGRMPSQRELEAIHKYAVSFL